MDLLGGYGSDGSDAESDEDAQPSAPKQARKPKSDAEGKTAPASDGGAGNKKVINFSKLPVRRPLVLDDKEGSGEEAPLRKAAEAENLRQQAGLSLLAALPAPKVTLGIDVDQTGAGSRIDLSEVKAARSSSKQVTTSPDVFHNIGSIMRGESAPDVAETNEVPKDMMNHPMFRNDATAGAGGATPSAQELHEMRNMKFKSINAADVQDPDWYMNNQISGGPGLHKGKKVQEEISMYEQKSWEKTTHANPSRNQKRKHQINWLAHEAMEKEAEMLDRAASSRLTKAQTSMKYGW